MAMTARYVLDEDAPSNGMHRHYGIWDTVREEYVHDPVHGICWGMPYDAARSALRDLLTDRHAAALLARHAERFHNDRYTAYSRPLASCMPASAADIGDARLADILALCRPGPARTQTRRGSGPEAVPGDPADS
jgi:hypothetical protein